MAGATIHMSAKKQQSLDDIHRKIHAIDGAEQICRSIQTINDVTICTLAYEKYYLRTGSYASVTIVLTEYGQEQSACIVSSGGGEGVVNLSLGANRNFAKACVRELEASGFTSTKSDIQSKSFLERLLK